MFDFEIELDRKLATNPHLFVLKTVSPIDLFTSPKVIDFFARKYTDQDPKKIALWTLLNAVCTQGRKFFLLTETGFAALVEQDQNYPSNLKKKVLAKEDDKNSTSKQKKTVLGNRLRDWAEAGILEVLDRGNRGQRLFALADRFDDLLLSEHPDLDFAQQKADAIGWFKAAKEKPEPKYYWFAGDQRNYLNTFSEQQSEVRFKGLHNPAGQSYCSVGDLIMWEEQKMVCVGNTQTNAGYLRIYRDATTEEFQRLTAN